ncbi:MAG: DUF975 family protein [Firmicutes bacterium]|nr:DUF975 family protein [Bacillota bacterium]
MEYRIVNQPSAKIREVARTALTGNWKAVVLFMFLYYLITDGVGMVLDLFFSTTQMVPIEDPLTGEYIQQTVGYGSGIYSLLISGPAAWGLSKYMLDFFRNKKTEITTLFEGFSYFGKAFVLLILMGVKIFLWTLLFIVPGIIATYRYSQAFYVLIDHPEYSANQCLKESTLMMKGNKWKLFCLELSFIGWGILASLPAGILSGLNLGISGGFGGIIMAVILAIPTLFVHVYMNVAATVFYELAADNLVIMEAGQSLPEGRWEESEGETDKPEDEI